MLPTHSSTVCVPTPLGQLPDPRDTLVTALEDDVGGAELAAEVGAAPVAAHQDDAVRAESLGRENGAQADCAVADHGHRGAW
jgi:hypothetical protein